MVSVFVAFDNFGNFGELEQLEYSFFNFSYKKKGKIDCWILFLVKVRDKESEAYFMFM